MHPATRSNPAQPQASSIDLRERLRTTRALSEELASPLSPEDQVVQSMEDASPTKWHLAHVTWFFETFILNEHLPGYEICHPDYNYCFNSYYNAIGDRHPRNYRGLLTRPSHDAVMAYRKHVDEGLARLFDHHADQLPNSIEDLIELGINHEQQHQELLLTDALHMLSASPLLPAYLPPKPLPVAAEHDESAPSWHRHNGGIVSIGHTGKGFHYDNEGPRHEVLLQPFEIADRLVTNADWIAFMEDGNYTRPDHWLADGWATAQQQNWKAPLYWEKRDDTWHQMSLRGLQPIDPNGPVCHVSYFEADAYARWSGQRLPTEFEWEATAQSASGEDNTVATRNFRPVACAQKPTDHPRQLFGDVWEWTSSAYAAYPGYRPPPGAVGEYNGKFMCSQFVLRGASCATAPGHSRPTYRNFFYPHQRWQFMGLRLARDLT